MTLGGLLTDLPQPVEGRASSWPGVRVGPALPRRRTRTVRVGCLLAAALALAGCARPKEQAAIDAGARAAQVTLCAHRVPAELCTDCNPELAPVFKAQGDWCDTHQVPKSLCLACDPGLKFTAAADGPPGDWCSEHAVPESACTRCNPRLVAKFIAAGDYCREHGFPASVCPVHHPELAKAAGHAPAQFPEPGAKVRLRTPSTARAAGIQTRPAELRKLARTLEVVGQLSFDQNRHARLSARGESLVLEVKVDVGDEVKAGQALLALASSSVGEDQARLSAAKARLETARTAFAREKELASSGVSPRRNAEEAERELAAAQAQHDAARSALGAAGASSEGTGGRYVLTAPFGGTVVARDAVPGRSASPGQTLLEVADLAVIWAQLDVPEGEAGEVRPGQPVQLALEGSRARQLQGTIARVGAAVDRRSRTVPARIELPNPEHALKAGAFVRARIRVSAEHEALLIPLEAVQRAEGRAVVFVKKDAQVYEPVAVKLGQGDASQVEVLEGLAPGAQVVTTGAFLLKTELLKDSIGAGCCDEGAP